MVWLTKLVYSPFLHHKQKISVNVQIIDVKIIRNDSRFTQIYWTNFEIETIEIYLLRAAKHQGSTENGVGFFFVWLKLTLEQVGDISKILKK